MADEKKQQQSGYVDVALSRPIKAAGADVPVLRMREPTVADQYANDKMQGTDADRELSMMANLCMVTSDDLKQLTLRDYKAVQKAFLGFIG